MSKIFLMPLLRIYGILCILTVVIPDHLIFRPHASSYKTLPQQIFIQSGEVMLSGVFLKNPQATYTVCFFHGNAEDLGDIWDYLNDYMLQGFNVFAIDYRSYGQSTGKPSEKNCYLDLETVKEYVLTQKQIDPKTVIIHGRSLGGGMAAELATRMDCAGLILESTFVSAFRVLTHWPLLPFDQFKNLKKLSLIKAPVLVMHGRKDAVIPYWHGQKLYQHIQGYKDFLGSDTASHNDLLFCLQEEYWQKIRDFSTFLNTH